MITLDQLKQHYLKDLFSFRQMESFLYNGTKLKKGLVFGVLEARDIVDSGFWNNDNLVNQFDANPKKSTGSKFLDVVTEVAMDSETQKQIEKASEESTGKLVFYVQEEDYKIYADLIFFNKSKNRILDRAELLLNGLPATFDLKTFSAHSGSKSFEDVITVPIGDFEFFKESVLGKKCAFYFNSEKDEYGEAKDFLSMEFDVNLPLVDVAAVDCLVNGDKWDQSYKDGLWPSFDKEVDMDRKQEELDGMTASIKASKKKAKRISWISAVVLLFIIANVFPEMEGGAAFLSLIAVISVGMSGKYIGNKMNADKEEDLKRQYSVLSDKRKDIETTVKGLYSINS